jgi:restriction system protein
MSIPDYQSIMLPLLEFARDEREHTVREAIEFLAAQFGLTEQERKMLLPSGQQAIFDNRVGWARTYLKKAGLLESPRRGYFRITSRGLEILRAKPMKIDVPFLEQFPEFVEFRSRRREAKFTNLPEEVQETPEEVLERAYQDLRRELARELLDYVKKCSPRFFEQLVIDLLVRMGYGGSREDAARAIGRTGDEGIDGIINEDRLGLDTLYIQAKRWDGVVGRPEVQRFAGALQGQRARKGILITTSHFSEEAREYAARIDSKIVLIDGERLAELMIDYGVGVSKVTSYEIKKIDQDYFTEA